MLGALINEFFITTISGYSTFAQKLNYENAFYSKHGVGD